MTEPLDAALRAFARADGDVILEEPTPAKAARGLLVPPAVSDCSSVAVFLSRLLDDAPFAGRSTIRMLHGPRVVPPAAFAVCIPLRDEEALLPGMLTALECALSRVSEPGAVIFVANDTTDRSVALLAQWSRSSVNTVHIVDAQFDPAIRTSPYARRLALDLGGHLAPAGHLLTTDADTRVDPDWLAANLRLLDEGADLVCGKVDLDASDLAALPARVHECGMLERSYGQMMARLWRLWTGSDALLSTPHALGASLAMRASCYRAVGGLPTPSSGEDKALARLALEHGFAVVNSAAARVVTSGRTEGRTAGGVSAALRERTLSGNPGCDEDLVPVDLLRRRADLWNGLAGSADRATTFERRCRTDPQLGSARMHRLDVESELEVAMRILAASTATSETVETADG